MNIEEILKRRKNKKTRDKFPINNFMGKWNCAENLLKHIHKKIHSKVLIQEARGQYIVSVITALEVFLNDTFESLIDQFNLDYKLIAKKRYKPLNIEEVESILKNKISMGELITKNCNFQNLANINESFSLILGFKFLEELKKYKWIYDKNDSEGFIKLSDDFYPIINNFLHLRHEFVHDLNFNKTITKKEIKDAEIEILNFANLISFFLEELFMHKIKWPTKTLKDIV